MINSHCQKPFPGLVLVSGILYYVARRARAVVSEREENYYIYQNIDNQRPSIVSNCSMASEDSLRYVNVIIEDLVRITNYSLYAAMLTKSFQKITWQTMIVLHLESRYPSQSPSNQMSKHMSQPRRLVKWQTICFRFIPSSFSTSSYTNINRLLPILPCSNGEAPTPMRVSRAEMKSLASIISLKMSLGNILIFMNIRVNILSRITGSVATVSSQQNSNVRRRRDSLSQENISNNRGGSLVNYDGSRRRKTVAFNPTLEVNNYNNSSSRRDSEGLSQQLSTLWSYDDWLNENFHNNSAAVKFSIYWSFVNFSKAIHQHEMMTMIHLETSNLYSQRNSIYKSYKFVWLSRKQLLIKTIYCRQFTRAILFLDDSLARMLECLADSSALLEQSVNNNLTKLSENKPMHVAPSALPRASLQPLSQSKMICLLLVIFLT